jgi:hypothetical protein
VLTAVAFSLNGARVFAHDEAGKLLAWDATTGRMLADAPLALPAGSTAVAVTHKRRASLDGCLVRIERILTFPLVTLQGHLSPHLSPVCGHLERAGFEVEVLAVDYEFQKADDHAGNRMLRARRKGQRT